MFVPAAWQHTVTNLSETLSINHNWITTANLDLVWDCIASEIKAVDSELRAWRVDCQEARENMLRGCVGLDVTTFLFMILLRALQILGQRQLTWEDCFDLVRLSDAMRVLVDDIALALRTRLSATLASSQLAADAYDIATKTVKTIEDLIDTAS
jgi:hypothetical protein